MMLWSLHTETLGKLLVTVELFLMYYDLFDNDISTSRTHFVSF